MRVRGSRMETCGRDDGSPVFGMMRSGESGAINIERCHMTKLTYRRAFRGVCVLAFCFSSLVALAADAPDSKELELLKKSRRTVFLGDSITAAGVYVAYFDAWLTAQRFEHKPEIIDAGLPSETVSGLSEEGHAGGKFPRPDLAERLERVLEATKPDLVIACYGMNCAIYHPFDEARFTRYKLGIEHLKGKVEKAHAQLILITPPSYDDKRSPRPFVYNEVLDKYSEWLLSKRKDGWLVIDLHTPMTRELHKRREDKADYTFQPDGVHPNEEGHWCVAQQLIRGFGDEASAAHQNAKLMLASLNVPEAAMPLIQQRVNVLRDAYVFAAGHKRPGVAQGLPIGDAELKAKELTAKINELIPPKP